MLMIILAGVMLGGAPDPASDAAVDLGWMQGAWRACGAGRETVETWSGDQDLMFGHAVTRSDGRIVMWEQMRIVHRDGATVYQVMPNGGAAVDFIMIDQSPRRAVFESRDNDWPNIIAYERQGDVLNAWVRGLEGEGEPEAHWSFAPADQRARCE